LEFGRNIIRKGDVRRRSESSSSSSSSSRGINIGAWWQLGIHQVEFQHGWPE
jgi:hypothetical protein